MIGYYVHHVGRGHLHRAQQVAARLHVPVTGLSSCARPEGWPGPWVQLPRDDGTSAPREATAGGALHWAPMHHPGLRERAGLVSAWIKDVEPRLVVVDVSVEMTLLVRLHGVPVVSVVLPGERGDVPHRTAHAASSALVAAWPAQALSMVSGLTSRDRARLQCVGAVGRASGAMPALGRSTGRRRIVVMVGAGGTWADTVDWNALETQTPDWEWVFLGIDPESWVQDPEPVLASADVVLTHAGQSAVAEVAAVRRPALIVPADRPHREQHATAAVLQGAPWPALVEAHVPRDGWAARLDEVAAYDGAAWGAWNDGHGAARFAALIHDLLDETTP